jgi:hypothetical protein
MVPHFQYPAAVFQIRQQKNTSNQPTNQPTKANMRTVILAALFALLCAAPARAAVFSQQMVYEGETCSGTFSRSSLLSQSSSS